MATLKLTILKAKILKNGRHKVRIAVCHKQETTYIITKFIIDDLSQFKNGQVVKRPDASMINTKLRNLLNMYQERLDEIKNPSSLSCTQLKEFIMSDKSETITFKYVSDKYIEELILENRKSYATLLERNCRYFTDFTKGDLPMENITTGVIENYSKFLKKKGLSDTSINMMLSRTRTIINKARRNGLNMPNPFSQIKIKEAPVRECDISISDFNKIRDYEPRTRKYIVAKDIFLLTFYLGGINLIDLMNMKFNGNEIAYSRKKTINTKENNSEIRFEIPEKAQEIIRKWLKNGKLNFGYKFSYPNFSRYVVRNLADMCEDIGIKQRVILYSARKSFAQYASELGIPDSVIDYLLGHSDKSKGVLRYYTKVKQKQATMALQRVIEYVDNPDKFKQYIEMRSDIMMIAAK